MITIHIQGQELRLFHAAVKDMQFGRKHVIATISTIDGMHSQFFQCSKDETIGFHLANELEGGERMLALFAWIRSSIEEHVISWLKEAGCFSTLQHRVHQVQLIANSVPFITDRVKALRDLGYAVEYKYMGIGGKGQVKQLSNGGVWVKVTYGKGKFNKALAVYLHK